MNAPQHPVLAVMGGARFPQGKVHQHVALKVDHLVIGGKMTTHS